MNEDGVIRFISSSLVKSKEGPGLGFGFGSLVMVWYGMVCKGCGHCGLSLFSALSLSLSFAPLDPPTHHLALLAFSVLFCLFIMFG